MTTDLGNGDRIEIGARGLRLVDGDTGTFSWLGDSRELIGLAKRDLGQDPPVRFTRQDVDLLVNILVEAPAEIVRGFGGSMASLIDRIEAEIAIDTEHTPKVD